MTDQQLDRLGRITWICLIIFAIVFWVGAVSIALGLFTPAEATL